MLWEERRCKKKEVGEVLRQTGLVRSSFRGCVAAMSLDCVPHHRKSNLLEEALAKATEDSEDCASRYKPSKRDQSDTAIDHLIAKRRQLIHDDTISAEDKKRRRNEVSKQIQKEIKRKLCRRRSERISKILSEFRGLKDLTNAGSVKKKDQIVSMTDDSGARHFC